MKLSYHQVCTLDKTNLLQDVLLAETIGYDGPVSIEVFPKDYWKDDAEWIVSECYKTTKAFMEKNGFIDTAC